LFEKNPGAGSGLHEPRKYQTGSENSLAQFENGRSSISRTLK
jgi:hypothetical protein